MVEDTPIDLGDDLLEEKATAPTPKSGESISDLLETAKILIGESLIEDAKKVLRQVLILDSRSVAAKTLLEEIHQNELKKMFKGEAGYPQTPVPPLTERLEQDSEALIRKLDEDLNLGVFSAEISLGKANQLSLFKNAEMMEEYSQKLLQSLSQSSAQDWLDMGVAFLEMDLITIAVRLFSGACRKIGPEPENQSLRLSATSLLALAFILAGQPHEAIAQIQPLLQDTDIPHENKIELFYLMGKTFEAMNKGNIARSYYRQVFAMDSRYRDVVKKIIS